MKVLLLGLEFNVGNRGCQALGISFLNELRRISEELNEQIEYEIISFSGKPWPKVPCTDEVVPCYEIKVKKLSFWRNSYLKMKSSDLIFDFTSGDSFSDIYGLKRFTIASLLKQMALWSKKPFILGPQTYGPYKSIVAKVWAKHIIKKASEVFARDSFSADYVKKLCDRDLIRVTDVAFGLPYNKINLSSEYDKIKVGYNPSGLLWTGGYTGKNQFSLKVNYQDYTREIIKSLLETKRYEVHLVPHVWNSNLESNENDLKICRIIQDEFPEVIVASDIDDASDVKTYISDMDVFIGARMHSTIASFSSGVATIPFSYSRKFEGLYSSLEYPFVLSAQTLTNSMAVEKTLRWIEEFTTLEEHVSSSMNLVQNQLDYMHDEFLRVVNEYV